MIISFFEKRVRFGSEKSLLMMMRKDDDDASPSATAAYFLSTFATNSASELYVLRHDCDSLGVNGTQVGIFEKSDEISLTGLLQSHDGRALEAKIGLEILSNLTDETLKGQLAYQQFSTFLVTTDLSKSDRSRPVTMGLLDAAGSRGALSSCLRCKLLPWSFSTSRFTSSLLRTCHDASQLFNVSYSTTSTTIFSLEISRFWFDLYL